MGVPRLVLSALPTQHLPPAGITASLGLHLAFLAALLLLAPRPALPPLPEIESLSVELVSPTEPLQPRSEAPVARQTPAAATPAPPAPRLKPRERVAKPPPDAPGPLAHARRILSSGALDAKARRSLAGLTVEDRFEQLCDVEALEQIAARNGTLKPERAVAYATADPTVEGNVITATGAAYLDQGRWYTLSFRCETTPDHRKVVSFDFSTGGPLRDLSRVGTGESDD